MIDPSSIISDLASIICSKERMKNELAELVRDVREQVLYLEELGVDALDVKMIEMAPDVLPPENSVPQPIQKSPAPKIEIKTPPKKTSAGARLASLPSLARRTPAAPGDVPPPSLDNAPEPATIAAETMFGSIT